MAETKKEKGLTLTKGETIQLAATLKELHYGSLSSDGAMKPLVYARNRMLPKRRNRLLSKVSVPMNTRC